MTEENTVAKTLAAQRMAAAKRQEYERGGGRRKFRIGDNSQCGIVTGVIARMAPIKAVDVVMMVGRVEFQVPKVISYLSQMKLIEKEDEVRGGRWRPTEKLFKEHQRV